MDVTRADIRALVDRPTTDVPVTSIYLNTDGAQLPRPSDYEARLDALLRDVRRQAEHLGHSGRESAKADADAIRQWVRTVFKRGDVRGLGVFSSGGKVFETVQVGIPVRNIARVHETPYVVPLEALLSRHHSIGLVLIERDKARIFRYRLGRAEEWSGLESDVHRQHERGGWSQARFQRNIEHEVAEHFKEAAEILRKAHESDPFDGLVLAGAQPETTEFARHLHPYLQKVLHPDPVSLPSTPSADELKARFKEVEQHLVSRRRAERLQRLAAAQGQAEKAARGVRHVLEAVNSGRVEVLFVVEGAGVPGFRSATGTLTLHEDEAEAYGGPVEPVGDLIDEIIEAAVRSGADIELFRDSVRLGGHPVAGLLRF
ncbi:MAG: Vms1/Ankzf1 family peptidyl-tRNA hydrolase [Egibacteraceae bacterium]